MSNDETLSAKDIQSYDFGDPVAPEGFNPDTEAYENTPPGWHVFDLIDFKLAENKEFKHKEFGVWVGTQLRPRLRVPEGFEDAGTTQIDFLPFPTPGRQMPTVLANQWANFARAFGIQIPSDRLVPQGFKIHDLLNGNDPDKPARPFRRGRAEVVTDEYDGKTKLRIGYFRYKPLNGNGNGGSATTPAAPAAEAPPLDLDSL